MSAAELMVVRYAQRVSVDTISSERLDLPLLSANHMEALLDGKVADVGRAIGATISPRWLRDNAWLLARRARQIRDNPAALRWLLRPIVVRRGARPVAGTINFHGDLTSAAWWRSATCCSRAS